MVRFLSAVLLVALAVPALGDDQWDVYEAATAANSTCNWHRDDAIAALYSSSERWQAAAIVRTSCLSIDATAADLAAGDAMLAGGEVSAQFAIADMWRGHGWWDTANPKWMTGFTLWWMGYIPPAVEQFEISTPAYDEATRNYARASKWFTVATGDFQAAEDAYWTVYGRLATP